jgi:DNA-binding transcriptional LysR family regulator
MEMHQIRYFLALCEELNFTRAARRSGVTQPSLTNAIRALEGELGGALFQRKPRIVLTELGAAIRPYLVEIDRHAVNARETARLLAPPVGATPFPAISLRNDVPARRECS